MGAEGEGEGEGEGEREGRVESIKSRTLPT